MITSIGSGPFNKTVTKRWTCSECGDLTYLDDNDLCRQCQPEPVVEEFAVIAMRALCGEPEKVERVWRIG